MRESQKEIVEKFVYAIRQDILDQEKSPIGNDVGFNRTMFVLKEGIKNIEHHAHENAFFVQSRESYPKGAHYLRMLCLDGEEIYFFQSIYILHSANGRKQGMPILQNSVLGVKDLDGMNPFDWVTFKD